MFNQIDPKLIEKILRFHCAITNGECEKDGWHSRKEDILGGHYPIKKKYFHAGDDFPNGDWIGVPED